MKLTVFGDIADCNMDDFSIAGIPEGFQQRIRSSDYAIFNLEGPVVSRDITCEFQIFKNRFTDHAIKLMLKLLNKKQPEVFSSPELLQLKHLNPNLVFTLANNHIKDRGIKGFSDCISLLRKNGIQYLGAGMTKSEANQPLMLQGKACNLYLLNYNLIGLKKGLFFNIYGAGERDFGAAFLNFQKIREVIGNIRKKDSQAFILLILHAGRCFAGDINDLRLNFKQLSALDAQVKVVHHMHQHYETPFQDIFFLGDFIFNIRNPRYERTGSFLEIIIDSGACWRVNQVAGYGFQDGYPCIRETECI